MGESAIPGCYGIGKAVLFYLHERLRFMVNVGKYSVHRSYGNCVQKKPEAQHRPVETWWVGKNWYLSAMLNFKAVLAEPLQTNIIQIPATEKTCHYLVQLWSTSLILHVSVSLAQGVMRLKQIPHQVMFAISGLHHIFTICSFFCVFTVSFLYITMYTFFFYK